MAEIRYGRRTGNSTRILDELVQALFDKGEVTVIDHYEDGTHENANKNLFSRFLKRIALEHSGIVSRLEINERKLFVRLSPD